MCRLNFVGYWGLANGCLAASPVVCMRDGGRVAELRNISLDIDAGGLPVSHIYVGLMWHDGRPIEACKKDMARVSEGIPDAGIVRVGHATFDLEGVWKPMSNDNLFCMVAGAFDRDENMLAGTTSSIFRVMTRRTGKSHELREEDPLLDFSRRDCITQGWAY